jgi:hypothetical protein
MLKIRELSVNIGGEDLMQGGGVSSRMESHK